MKTLLFACLSLAGAIAQAGEITLKPYFPSPFASEPFSQSAMCHVLGLDDSGNWSGVCRYYGNYSRNANAVVTWGPTGTPLAAQPCWGAAWQGTPVCPALTYGNFEELDGQAMWVQGISGGVMAVILDTTPRQSVLITP